MNQQAITIVVRQPLGSRKNYLVIVVRVAASNNNHNRMVHQYRYITNGKPWWEDECVRDKPPSKVIPLYTYGR